MFIYSAVYRPYSGRWQWWPRSWPRWTEGVAAYVGFVVVWLVVGAALGNSWPTANDGVWLVLVLLAIADVIALTIAWTRRRVRRRRDPR